MRVEVVCSIPRGLPVPGADFHGYAQGRLPGPEDSQEGGPVPCRVLSVRGLCQSPAAWRKLLWGDLSDPRRPEVSCRMCLDMI